MIPSNSPPVGVDRLTLTVYDTDTSLDQRGTVGDPYAEIYTESLYNEDLGTWRTSRPAGRGRSINATFGSWWHGEPTSPSGLLSASSFGPGQNGDMAP
jgi:hypothetical protein